MRQLLSGFIAAGSLVAALYFLKYWRASRDRLLGLFGAAFVIMSLNHVALGLTSPEAEVRVVFYVVRLVAFLLTLAGIWMKTRTGP